MKKKNSSRAFVAKRPKSAHKKPKISKFNSEDSSKILLFGTHPCLQAILNKRRKIYQIFTTKNSHDELLLFLKKNNLIHLQNFIKKSDKYQLDRMVGEDHNHQDLVISATKLPIKNQIDLLEMLHNQDQKKQMPNILILDQITDPHNIGAIIRSAAAFNFNIIVFSQHNSVQENSVIAKSAAGNLEFMHPYFASNINDLIIKLKKLDYWNIGLSGESKNDISQITKYQNKAVILGSEGKGIRHLVKKNCDILLKIDICNNVESLNVANAAAIALFAASKVR